MTTVPLTPEQALTFRLFPDIRRQAIGTLVAIDRRYSTEEILQAINAATARHDAFQITFDDHTQHLLPRRAIPVTRAPTLAQWQALGARANVPIDEAPLAQFTVRASDSGHLLYLGLHHLVHDGLSVRQFLRELAYSLDPDTRPFQPAPRQFAAYAEWMNRPLPAPDLARLRQQWEAPARDIDRPPRDYSGENRFELVRTERTTGSLRNAADAIRVKRGLRSTEEVVALTAVLVGYRRTFGKGAMHLCVAHNGRTESTETIRRTFNMIGLAVTHYYTVLTTPAARSRPADAYDHVEQQLANLPPPSTYGRVYESTPERSRTTLDLLSRPTATFIYHSSATADLVQHEQIRQVPLPPGSPRTGARNTTFSLSIESDQHTGSARLACSYSSRQFAPQRIAAWMSEARRFLIEV